MLAADVPSPIDLCDPADARAWEASAQSRPGRAEMFAAFHTELEMTRKPNLNVLELGSGPGFLAGSLLAKMPGLTMTLLDFSEAMHVLARARLGAYGARLTYMLRNFKSAAWANGLGTFDAVVTNQAVHELRHKRHASLLHSQVGALLARDGVYLVADHYCGEGGMANDQLFMSIEEHAAALRDAGYRSVTEVARSGSLVMHRVA